MSVFEIRIVFQTVPNQSIEANVAKPNETNGERQVVVPTVKNEERW